MSPEGIVGNVCWNALNKGGVITGIEQHRFIVRQQTGLFNSLVIDAVTTVNRRLPLGKKEQVVQEIRKRAAQHYQDPLRLNLRLAASGIIRYNTATDPLREEAVTPITSDHINDFCRDTDAISVRNDLASIENGLNRSGLRHLFSRLLKNEDIKRCQSIKNLSLNDTWIQQVQGYIGNEITLILATYFDKCGIDQVLQSLRNNKAFPSEAERAIDNLNLLLLRLFMTGVGLIPPVEMKYAWQHFINEINSFKMWSFRKNLWNGNLMGSRSGTHLQEVIDKCNAHQEEGLISHKENNAGVKLIHELIYCDMPNTAPIGAEIREPEHIESYVPEMERATKAPGLPNQGYRCYYNAVIKMLANQFSMEQLKSSLKEDGDTPVGDTLAAEKQQLKEKLINVLISIKYCRSGLCSSGWVCQKSTEFLQHFPTYCQKNIFNKEFSDNRQNDVHELVQILNQVLGYSDNPKYAFWEKSQLMVRINEHLIGTRCIEVNSGEMIINPNLKKDECASYSQCLNAFLQEETIHYSWWDNSFCNEFGLRLEALLENNINNMAEYQKELESYKESIAHLPEYASDKDSLKRVKSMKLKADGYFERQTSSGGVEYSAIPPWIKHTKKISLAIDPEELQSIMLSPRIFSYTDTGRKLHNEGIAFFQSCLGSVEIPVVDLQANALNINTEVIGFCGHKGDVQSGHYVYFEKSSNGWVLNNDEYVEFLGDDNALQMYLIEHKMTPYCYHLKLDGRS